MTMATEAAGPHYAEEVSISVDGSERRQVRCACGDSTLWVEDVVDAINEHMEHVLHVHYEHCV